MRWPNWKIIFTFMCSPFLSGIGFAMIFFINFFGKEPILQLLMSVFGMGFFGVIFFFIPATAIGIIYLKTINFNRLIQELLCCTMGLVFSMVWSGFIFGDFFSHDVNPFHWYMGLTGLLTAFFVSFMLNHKMKKKYRNS